jgi:hypothetical protein
MFFLDESTEFQVISVFYKHGEYTIASFHGPSKLREFLEVQILDHGDLAPSFLCETCRNRVIKGKSSLRADYEKFNGFCETCSSKLSNFTLSELCKISVELGLLVKEQQRGYGIVAIIQGYRIADIC